MDDLASALAFAKQRIEAQAVRSHEPLDDDERFLLANLPIAPVFLQPYPFPDAPSDLVRDVSYEKLIAMAKAAMQEDNRTDSRGLVKWQVATAVCKLHSHPMAWLLERAGVRVPKPWWDGWLLWIVSALFVVLMFAVLFSADTTPSVIGWAAGIAAYVAVLAVLYLATRRMEKWQLAKFVASCERGATLN
jgi:hypothetical protein